MGIRYHKFTMYALKCDRCGIEETLYTGDGGRNGRVVRDIPSAIYAAGFHRTKGALVCDECFREKGYCNAD